MTTATLPTSETDTPADQAELAALVRDAASPVYPIGGGTSLDYGLISKEQGRGLSLATMNRVVDYPARDMTITVEAGITMAALAQTLKAEKQWLPVDVPQAGKATLGGVIATNTSGPRRYGCGTIRDYVIGISAVDGRGVTFKAGGRVVKNVAGYDLCKLLVGSMGTLGVITQVTLKVRPQPAASAFAAVDIASWAEADTLLAGLVNSKTTPMAVELLTGAAWAEDEALGSPADGMVARLAVGLEGTQVEADWMLDTLSEEWSDAGHSKMRRIDGDRAASLWTRLIEFPANETSPLVLKAGVLPSRVTAFIEQLLSVDAEASIQAHAGDGVLIARLPNFSAADVSQKLVGDLQSAAAAGGGHLCVLSSSGDFAWTRRAFWGASGDELGPMQAVKAKLDPRGILNPNRFVYD